MSSKPDLQTDKVHQSHSSKAITRKRGRVKSLQEHKKYKEERKRLNTKSARRRRQIKREEDAELIRIYERNEETIELLEVAVEALLHAIRE